MSELSKLREAIYSCKRCASCREWDWYDPSLPGFMEGMTKTGFSICPVYKHSPGFETDFARGKVRLARGLLEDSIEINERLKEKAFQCTMCGNCYEHCPGNRQQKLNPVEVIRALREEILERGEKAPKGIKDMRSRTISAKVLPETWVPRELRNFREGSLGVFLGCVTSGSVSMQSPTIALSILETLQSLDIPYQVIDDGWCCGNPYYLSGQAEVARRHAEANHRIVKERALTAVVTTCSGCYSMFKNEYPTLLQTELGVPVLHSVELLARAASAGRITGGKPVEGKVTYHDPCELGRRSGLYDQPRVVMRAVAGDRYAELQQTRENSCCCGAGGGVKSTFPGLALSLGQDRVRQVLAEGFSTIVTACPSCVWNLRDSVREEGASLDVMDIADFVREYARFNCGSTRVSQT